MPSKKLLQQNTKKNIEKKKLDNFPQTKRFVVFVPKTVALPL